LPDAGPLYKFEGAVYGNFFAIIPSTLGSESKEVPITLVAATVTTIRSLIARPRLVVKRDIRAVHLVLVTTVDKAPLQMFVSVTKVLFFAFNLTRYEVTGRLWSFGVTFQVIVTNLDARDVVGEANLSGFVEA